jgi:putative PEP-CTERM system histidine kinase
MNGIETQALLLIGFASHFGAAVACAVAAFWIYRKGDRSRLDRSASLAAIGLTGLWCAVAATFGPGSFAAQGAESLRNLAWIALLFRLFANDGRHESLRPIRPVILVLAFVEILQPFLLFAELRLVATPRPGALTFQIAAVLRMMEAIGALVLLHNLYAGAAGPSRQLLRWSAIALGGFWAFELNLYTIAYLAGEPPAILVALKGVVSALIVAALALGSNARTAGLHFLPSRAVTFQTLSLFVIGAYLFAMLLMTRSLTAIGGDFARFAQVGFLALATIAAIAWLPSQKLRGWMRVMVAKHFFRHRYDYREEWLRFTRTIGQACGEEAFHERAVKAVADITDSPGGLLLMPNEEAELELVARWNWPTADVPMVAGQYSLSGMLEQKGFILDLDQLREGGNGEGASIVPEWLLGETNAWAVVPLLHLDRLVGALVLARPRFERRLDWEDFDLLRVVGQQLASYLAEQSSQQALLEANRFDEFNRRIAFVMHDIKNLASQVTLLARNAEKHADNPEFRADMLVTLRNSADKLNALLTRLGRYGPGAANRREPIDLKPIAVELSKRFAGQHEVHVVRSESCRVLGDRESLEQAIIHLVQNAIDASAEGQPVYLEVSSDGLHGRIEIIDSGCGMSPRFVRNELFKPFVSSKNGGFGIGAFEARELIRAMGGRLVVESREGVGTKFVAALPLAAAAEIDFARNSSQEEVA